MSLLDAFIDYLSARFRLEAHRFEAARRAAFLRLAVTLGAALVAVFGFILLSIGIAAEIGARAGWPPGGLLIVGAFYTLAGAIVAAVAARRRRS